MADIFLSYSRTDRERVRPMIPILEARGWSVFWDPSIEPGQRWDDLIATELQNARCVVVCWSQSAVLSRWVKDEASTARDRDVLVPVSIDGTHAPLGFRQIQTEFLDERSGGLSGASVDRFVAGVRRMLDTKDDEDAMAVLPAAVMYDFRGSAGTSSGLNLAPLADGSYLVDALLECGDSYVSSMATASLMANAHRVLANKGIPPPADVIILGLNDPHTQPSLETYEQALVRPLASTVPESMSRKSLFAAPGYHRSAEALSHFETLFCAARNRAARGVGLNFEGLQTHQSDRYFALSLPHHWWIWGLDLRYGEPLDPRQFNYFSLVAEKFSADDAIILFLPQDNWLLSAFDTWREQANLQKLIAIAEGQGARVASIICGGRLEYGRYTIPGRHAAVLEVGGGRAFVSPTHGLAKELSVRWKAQARSGIDDSVVTTSLDEASPMAMRERGDYERDLAVWYLQKSGQNGPREVTRGLMAQLISWAQRPEQDKSRRNDEAKVRHGAERMSLEQTYPPPGPSRWMALKNLTFSGRNFKLALSIGSLYWIVVWQFLSIVESHDISAGKIDAVGVHTSLSDVLVYMPFYILQALLMSVPFVVFLVAGSLLCIWIAPIGHSWVGRAIIGSLHYCAHAALAVTLGLIFIWANNEIAPRIEPQINKLFKTADGRTSAAGAIAKEVLEPLSQERKEQREMFGGRAPPATALPGGVTGVTPPALMSKSIHQVIGFVLFPIEMILIGGVVGGVLYGLYLTLTGVLSNRFAQFAFAAFRPKGNRVFLRMQFTPDSLTIYPIGLRKLPRRRDIARRDNAGFFPDLTAELVEPPLLITKKKASSAFPPKGS